MVPGAPTESLFLLQNEMNFKSEVLSMSEVGKPIFFLKVIYKGAVYHDEQYTDIKQSEGHFHSDQEK